MKKTFKKLFAILLAAAMVLAMAVPAFAETNSGTNGSITISNTVKNETYTIYRLFKLDSYNGDHYSYTVEENWKPFSSISFASSWNALDLPTLLLKCSLISLKSPVNLLFFRI